MVVTLNRIVMILIFCLLQNSFAVSFPIENGRSSYGFLKTGSPRTVSLNGAGIASPVLAAEAHSNPLALLSKTYPAMALEFTHVPKEIGARIQGLYLRIPMDSKVLGFGGRFVKFDDITRRDGFGVEQGAYGAASFDVSMAFASKGITQSSEWGAQVHYGQSNIDNAMSRAFFVDAALAYALGENFRMATTFSNLGTATEFDTATAYLPLTFQAGITHQFSFLSVFQMFSHLDLKRVVDEDPELILAGELAFRKLLTFRIGFPVYTKEEFQALSVGMSLAVGKWDLAYAYGGHKALSGGHNVSVEIGF
jgi:hypothetical protein